MRFIRFIQTSTLAAVMCVPMVSMAQLSVPEAEVLRLSRTPQMLPFMTYLRCEETPVARADDHNDHLEAASFLMQSYAAASSVEAKGEKNGQLGPIPLEIWPRVQAQVGVVAVQGFFGTFQFYRKADKDTLLKVLADAGWVFKRLPPDPNASSAMKLVQVYQASLPAEKPTRTLTLMDARIGLDFRVTDFDGLTLMCQRGEKRK